MSEDLKEEEEKGTRTVIWTDRLGIDVDLLTEIIENVFEQTQDDNTFTSRDFAESVSNVYSETIDEPAETRETPYFKKLIGKIASVVIKRR